MTIGAGGGSGGGVSAAQADTTRNASGASVRFTMRHLSRELDSLHLVQPSNVKLGRDRAPSLDLGASPPMRITTRVRRFLREHGRKLWWLHSAYALALGAGVVAFAHKGFEHARWLAVSLGLVWVLLVLVFRLFAAGASGVRAFEASDPRTRVRFYVMTYALKNLYQGMLFFLLPFYWKSTTTDAADVWFVGLLGACAILSTLDIVFDRVLMRWRWMASAFHGITLFGCLNLVIPALFPDTRTLWSLLAAAGIAMVGFWTLHVTARVLKKKVYSFMFVLSVGAAVSVAYAARGAIPPVPMYVSSAAVGPKQLPDGRLAMEVKTLHPSVIQELIAVTDVVVPGGKGDRLRHVWRHDGKEVHRSTEETSRIAGPKGTVRLRSSLTGKDLPGNLVGPWAVDVETEDNQLVGRAEFDVVE
jgi:hypothetical protein